MLIIVCALSRDHWIVMMLSFKSSPLSVIFIWLGGARGKMPRFQLHMLMRTTVQINMATGEYILVNISEEA